jgi:hypothetical protein
MIFAPTSVSSASLLVSLGMVLQHIHATQQYSFKGNFRTEKNVHTVNSTLKKLSEIPSLYVILEE